MHGRKAEDFFSRRRFLLGSSGEVFSEEGGVIGTENPEEIYEGSRRV